MTPCAPERCRWLRLEDRRRDGGRDRGCVGSLRMGAAETGENAGGDRSREQTRAHDRALCRSFVTRAYVVPGPAVIRSIAAVSSAWTPPFASATLFATSSTKARYDS